MREHDEFAEIVARRVVEMLRSEPPVVDDQADALVWDTGRVAREIGRSREFVRDHRHELGVLPAEGERPRLLFDAEAVRRWATAREDVVGSGTRESPRARRLRQAPASGLGTGADLLPIGDEEKAA